MRGRALGFQIFSEAMFYSMRSRGQVNRFFPFRFNLSLVLGWGGAGVGRAALGSSSAFSGFDLSAFQPSSPFVSMTTAASALFLGPGEVPYFLPPQTYILSKFTANACYTFMCPYYQYHINRSSKEDDRNILNMSMFLEFHLNVQNWVGFGYLPLFKNILRIIKLRRMKTLDRNYVSHSCVPSLY